MPLRHTSFRIDDESRAWLQAEAQRRGVSESEVARQAIAWYQGWLAHQRGEGTSRTSQPDEP